MTELSPASTSKLSKYLQNILFMGSLLCHSRPLRPVMVRSQSSEMERLNSASSQLVTLGKSLNLLGFQFPYVKCQ